MTISWTSLESIDEISELQLSFKATSSGLLSEMLTLNREHLQPEFYTGDQLVVSDMHLGFEDMTENSFTLYQNVPNPYNGETVISFQITTPGDVEFSIFDMTGRQLFGQTGYYDSGRHELLIDASMVDARGVLYYQISMGNQVATKKMISIE